MKGLIYVNTNLTEIIFLIDRSGSMSGLETDTIGGFNGFIIFLGANIDAAKEAGSIGICADNAISFEATGKGVEAMYCRVSEAVSEKMKR
jgi:hypothetical protein